MKLIIPMAGNGKRMRPHTLTLPKPLIPIAGKPIVERLVQTIAASCKEKIATIGFIVDHMEEAIAATLQQIAKKIGAEAKFYFQKKALGTAHALLCAQEMLTGKIIVAFADMIFKSSFTLDTHQQGIVWVKKVAYPSAFGVVKLNANKKIIDFVEKPKNFVSDLAIIGIYYFQEGHALKKALQYLIEQNLTENGEYQITTALAYMKNQGMPFIVQEVDDWLDCGNKIATVNAHKQLLAYSKDDHGLVSKTARINNSIIIPPVSIGENVVLNNTVLGPYVSVGSHSHIHDSRIQNSIIQKNSNLHNANLQNSMLGSYVNFTGKSAEIDIGDYNTLIGQG